MVLKKCSICSRVFSKTEHVKRHERSHTKERPYQCNVCLKRFSRSDVLSRHAKGHETQLTATGGPSDALNRRYSAIAASPMNAAPEIPAVAEAYQLPSLSSTPQDMPLVPHHARSGSELGAMMIDERQPYFGWNEVTPHQAPHRPSMAFDPVPKDMLQLWLEPHLVMSPGQQTQHSADSAKSSSDNIPTERFYKVQRCWPAPINSGRLINNLWRDIAFSVEDNVFSVQSLHLPSEVTFTQGSRCGLDEDCRRRLQAVFGRRPAMHPHLQSPNNGGISPVTPVSAMSHLPDFPPAEILDMALDLYFRISLVPFVHLPTFSARKTRPSLLYAMILIGMTLLDTKGTTDFVSRNFTSVLEQVTAEFSRCTVGVENASDTMTLFATALLFLHLPLLTGEKEHLEQCQTLYVNVMTVSQRHGLFTGGQVLDMSLFEKFADLDMRWKAWSKVESTKRIIIGLLLLDSCYSSFLSTSPITNPDTIQLILPCGDDLFNSHSSHRWTQLIRSGKRILSTTINAPSENTNIPNLENPTEDFCIQAILATVQIRQSEAYHRLLSNRASYPFAPCHTYAMDGRARCLPSLQFQLITNYGETFDRLSPNALIMWHHMCMMLTADIQIFDLAAGRAGPLPARKALDQIAEWAQTPAARRACLHAAHIYKAMTNRKASDHPIFHSLLSCFSAALVLGLYTFMVPDSANTTSIGSVELMDDVDWCSVGTEGFTSFMEPGGSQGFAPTDDPAVNFIRNGSTVYLRGTSFHGGYQSARRVLLDYASLLKDSGKWSVKKFSHILYIMSDVLMDLE
ncbi:uncharacterized protein N7446_003156 [Penicillium canescens]|uniref:C2H2-type domain-containing protein n=1 Tax=Penicillium canescens TaxID=5083 RepID=A0AAD6IFG5_PENCN|nr:uncharacterized protein N7446_003156 [Penicillium canescens]KAJ6044959.1 hypothetical protein N7460_006314 [Penicillium canescens]KAJ6056428.1 hypothetical protein N7444_005526 [Penicillium canescens]KAJ6075379.1 hypothetical protein N7446_003156 [Penicillium canescens]